MFAIVEIGGKQYKVQKGDSIYVEKIDSEIGSIINIDKVIMIDDKIGTPYLKNSSIKCKIEKHGKQKKVLILKHKRYTRSLKRQGHRQPYTKLVVQSIN